MTLSQAQMREAVDAEMHAALTKPAIAVRVGAGTPRSLVDPVLWGIEEEGVPSTLEQVELANPLELAHAAAQSSRLGVGVGIGLDYVVVTTDKLPPGKPYLAARVTSPGRQGRVLGADAARLVRGIELKPIDEEQS